MTEINYVELLEGMVTDYCKNMINTYGWTNEDVKLCEHFGVSTTRIGRKYGYPTAQHRIALKKLEKEGKVISSKQSQNQILWWPVGMLQKIREAKAQDVRNDISTKIMCIG